MRIIGIITFVFLLSGQTVAQKNEEAYKSALDSLDHYLSFYRHPEQYGRLRVVSYYHPEMVGVTEDTTDAYYFNRNKKKRKDCIFLYDGVTFLMLYLKDIDTSFIQYWRIGLRIADPSAKKKFIYNAIAREGNDRLGMLLEEYFIRPRTDLEDEVRRQKLKYYFNEVIRLSKKAR